MELSKPATFTVNGIPQALVSKIEFDAASEDKLVKTLALGAIGHSDGAEVIRANFEAAIPLTGRETDFMLICVQHRTVKLGMRMGGKNIVAEGRVLTSRQSSSVDNPNALDGAFEGHLVSYV